MKNRPISIIIIAWFMIISSSLNLIFGIIGLYSPARVKALMELNHMPISLQYVILFAGLIATFVSGVAILKRQNWARFLYVIWSVIGGIIGLTMSSTKMAMIPGVVFLIIEAIILFRPKVNDYFIGDQKCLS